MNGYLFAVLSGLLQGLTEFLPVSSSGHLALLHNLFGFEDPHLAFDVFLHLGTLTAVAAAYRKEIAELFSSARSLVGKLFSRRFSLKTAESGERLCMMLFVSTLPLALAAFLSDRLSAVAASSNAVGILLILNALLLISGDLAAGRKGFVPLSAIKPFDALTVGVCQLFAALPGISRSGSTVTGGLFAGMNREDAVKYSFLLSIPATAGAGIMNAVGMIKEPSAMPDPLFCLVGAATAAGAGLCAIKIIKIISKKTNFGVFAAYCFVLGLIALICG